MNSENIQTFFTKKSELSHLCKNRFIPMNFFSEISDIRQFFHREISRGRLFPRKKYDKMKKKIQQEVFP